ncbi:PAS domain-containing protein [Pseudoflavitalea sp. G-6-1-2]|uniref:PAS domain-containing protein n=1 Tax=Pseudoflavitalea sp. G-6-1-2 TaxID=2728841 RepID=UPI00146E7F2A|nr:PAS domain-containing protein [Pseudoflavitalea sp. G-6-1-2]NML21778.1 PAS domain-containing protein [Pseudoflavitalea sp. G-6-1-2]
MINSTHPLHILVIEDSQSDFYLFNEYLRLTKLPVQTLQHAQSLAEAITLVQDFQPDLIFLDLTLPDSEGAATFTQLHQQASHISIIVLSGLDDKQIALQTITEGAQDYLMKGEFDEKLLTKTIMYSLERKKILQHVVENYERYNTIIKATNDTIWEWNLNDHKITWNDGITNTFGYPASKVQPTTAWHHKNIHPDDRERVLTKIASCLSDGISQWEEEYRYLGADGSYRFVYDRGYILKSEHKPYGMIGAMLDITERKRKQEEQIETQKLITRITIQTQEQERRDIGLELHDNINQILATAKLCVDMAINEEDISKELLYKSYDSISKAINEIRSLSKNLVPPSLGDIGLKEALLEMIENMSVSQGLKIKIRANDPHVESLSNNKKLIIYRIVQEQVNNIVKHARASLAEIELKTDQQFTRLTIKDNGIGFDPRKKGKGIGLHNIMSRVEMQNGEMEIISAPGEGCTLKIVMPL